MVDFEDGEDIVGSGHGSLDISGDLGEERVASSLRRRKEKEKRVSDAPGRKRSEESLTDLEEGELLIWSVSHNRDEDSDRLEEVKLSVEGAGHGGSLDEEILLRRFSFWNIGLDREEILHTRVRKTKSARVA